VLIFVTHQWMGGSDMSVDGVWLDISICSDAAAFPNTQDREEGGGGLDWRE
jgi:hypothetical protein